MNQEQRQVELKHLLESTEAALGHVKLKEQEHVKGFFRDLSASTWLDAQDAKTWDEFVGHRAVARFIDGVILELEGHLESLARGYEAALTQSEGD